MVEETPKKSKGWKTAIILIAIAVAIIVGFNLVPKPESKIEVMDAFKNISLLKTVEFEVGRIIAKKEKTIIGNRYMVMELTAFIKAGFDLSSLSKENITEKDDEIIITLPEKLSVSFNFPPNKINEIFMDSTGLMRNFSPEKLLEEEQKAEDEIRKEFEDGERLKTDARSNLQENAKILEGILKKKVTIRYK